MRSILLLSWAVVSLIVVFTLDGCNGYKALFLFLFPAKSHYTTFVVLAEEMARRGHEVTVVTFFPKDNANFRQIVVDRAEIERVFQGVNVTEMRYSNRFKSCFLMLLAMRDMLDASLRSEGVQSVINSEEKYDVVLGEVSFFQPIVTAFGHKLNAPVIDLAPTSPFTFLASIMGNPHTFSYITDPLLALGNHMTYSERLYNTAYGLWSLAGEYLYLLPAQDAMMRKYFKISGAESWPPLREMMRNISLSLVNAHFSVSYPRPYSPNMVEVGGFHLKPVKKLPQDLQKFMDEAKNGVIYFSFGTVVREDMLSLERIQTIVSALKRLPQQVIFKWDNPAPFQDAKNILVLPFAPQQEILAHPNCLLFITHGGYNSLIEVTRAGVPVLGIPFFADQFRNIRYYESTGIGKGLDLDHFTSDELYDSIMTMIKTPAFRENAKEISRRAQDRPMNPLDTAIFWIEYVVRHKGAPHLKPSSVHMPYYQYLLIDVLGALLLVVFVVYKIICKLFCSKSISNASKTEKSTKKNN